MIDAEEYSNYMFAVKFYLKAHSLSKNKFRLTMKKTGDGLEGMHYEPSRIIATCLKVMLDLNTYAEGMASFCYLASSCLDEESAGANKRMRIYEQLMTSVFDINKYDHEIKSEMNVHLIVNKMYWNPSHTQNFERIIASHYSKD